MSLLVRFYLYTCVLPDTGADIVVLKTQPFKYAINFRCLGHKHGMWKIGLKTIRCYYESKPLQCLFSVIFWNLSFFFFLFSFLFFKKNFYWRVGMVPQGGSGLNLMDASDDLLDLMTKPLGAIDSHIWLCLQKMEIVCCRV